MRVADRDRRERDALVPEVELLGRADLDRADVERDHRPVDAGGRLTRAEAEQDVGGSGLARASQAAAIRAPFPENSAVEPSGFQI